MERQEWAGVSGRPVERHIAQSTGASTLSGRTSKGGVSKKAWGAISPLGCCAPSARRWAVEARQSKRHRKCFALAWPCWLLTCRTQTSGLKSRRGQRSRSRTSRSRPRASDTTVIQAKPRWESEGSGGASAGEAEHAKVDAAAARAANARTVIRPTRTSPDIGFSAGRARIHADRTLRIVREPHVAQSSADPARGAHAFPLPLAPLSRRR